MSGNLGERLRKLRGGLSREKFSKNIGISARALVNYETMERFPRGDIVAQIAARLGVSPTWLLTGEGEMTEKSGEKTSDSLENFDKEKGKHIDFTDVHKAKPLTRQSFLDAAKQQPVDFTESDKNKTSDMSDILLSELTARCLRLADVNAALLRENGDLRVEVERQKAELERRAARIADLERRGAVAVGELASLTDTDSNGQPGNCVAESAVDGCSARGLADNQRVDGEREGQAPALARLELENRTLRAQVRRLEQALAAMPAGTDILQNNIGPHAEREAP